ncbi:hypothetical protein TNCV_4538171 [Trichonephila clavipes]|nr:hypothetical protein TNCV_4538171 [Trichonephila clavipes]
MANEIETQIQYFIGPLFAQITGLNRLGIESICFWSAFTSGEYPASAMLLFRFCQLDEKRRVLSVVPFHHSPHKTRAMRGQGKVLEVRLMSSKTILNTSSKMYGCLASMKYPSSLG